MNEKLKKANKLSEDIEKLKDFKDLCEQGGAFSEKYQKQNTFQGLSISAKIWTGSDNPRYEKGFSIESVVKEIADAIIPILETNIQKFEKELNEIIK